MIEKISNCSNCNLCDFQPPLLDIYNEQTRVIWVGLSAKKVQNIELERPLENNTNTGKIIEKIESNNKFFYKTNLVKCVPLDESNKLRYPNKDEMNFCFENLILELITLKPQIAFLLGSKVSSFVFSKIKSKKFKNEASEQTKRILNDIEFINIYHPSYIAVYKRKEENNYINDVQNIIASKLELNVY